MKKKTIYIIGFILILSLVVAGCTNNQPSGNTSNNDDKDTLNDRNTDTLNDRNTDTLNDGDNDSPTQEPTSAGTDVVDEPAASNVTSVTQEELDQLMAGIQTLESDDISGLSE